MRHSNGRFRNQRTHPGVGHAHPQAVAASKLNTSGRVDHTNVKADLSKPPLPKRAFTETPQLHSGFNAKSRKDGTHFCALSGQDLSRYDADPSGLDTVSVVEGPPRGKRLSPVQPSFGQRDRTDDPVGGGVVVDGRNPAHEKAMLNRDEFTKGMVDISKDVLNQAANAQGSDAWDRMRFGKLPDSTTEGGG
jgi:hypothetical protein